MENPSTNKNSNKSRSMGPKPRKQGPRKRKQNRQRSIGNNKMLPLAQAREAKVKDPIYRTLDNGKTVRISHMEFIGNFTATNITTFAFWNRLRVNAASANTFGWLAGIAEKFERYKFLKLKFHFLTRVATTTSGSIIMAPDYDAADGQPSDEKLLLMMNGTVSSSVWKDVTLTLDPDRMRGAYKSHFCMSDNRFNGTSSDAKTIDCAQVFFAYDNIGGGTTNWGKVFVEYIVELSTPQPSALVLDDGGLRSSGVAGQMQSGAQPYLAQPTITQDSNDPILMPWAQKFPGNFPNGNMGVFLKDYEGLVQTVAAGTGQNGLGQAIVTQQGFQAPQVVQKSATIVNAAQTAQTRTDWIKAFAGDWLALGPVTATTVTSLNTLLGGSNNF